MPVTEYAGRRVDVNAEGFLTDSSQWTLEIGEAIAAESGVSLTSDHWTVIAQCREDGARRGFPPCLERLSELTGLPQARIGQLFPGNPGALVARIAGLPGSARPRDRS